MFSNLSEEDSGKFNAKIIPRSIIHVFVDQYAEVMRELVTRFSVEELADLVYYLPYNRTVASIVMGDRKPGQERCQELFERWALATNKTKVQAGIRHRRLAFYCAVVAEGGIALIFKATGPDSDEMQQINLAKYLVALCVKKNAPLLLQALRR